MDPYVEIIKTMRKEGSANNPMGLMIGKVVSVEPLRVSLGDVELERENLLIDENIVSERVVTVEDPVSGTITGKVIKTLSVGDSLVITQVDSIRFLAISKVI